MIVTITDKATRTVLARGLCPNQVEKVEGRWYFSPEAVSTSLLTIATETGPDLLGRCNQVHFGTTHQVAWLCDDTGRPQRAGRFCFRDDDQGPTRVALTSMARALVTV